ncbi:GIY-YIG nuclease family protein [Bradyrhizobium diazoefficiens]|nr:GIY-YIG nuclease family protein [Bradyrhizobium diazoefficiens]AND92928.1 hypothetical protein AAV28_38105 [Bradyrhizobium diazoefficiens USDA 110]BCF48123.1 hypothetical protein XF16B_86130 [Bradyrhizobium diazoefficiens]BCF74284.1 hypothetical protein XF19B_86370 [Bradyrhizobium diazoefficiens]
MTTDIDRPSTSLVHRPYGGICGYRLVSDRATRVVVHAFPMSDLSRVASAGLLGTPSAYVMSDGATAYFGESRKPSRRLSEHATDPAKAFARDVFVVGGCAGAAFDKLLIVDLQYRLTRLALEVGAVEVWKGANPPSPDLTDAERVTHDRIVSDALRLLRDAGCRIFDPAERLKAAPPRPEEVSPEESADAADSGPMAIGVATTPAGSAEFELRYGGLWARGYRAGDKFVVASGSEVRTATNGSVCALTRSRRDQLFTAGVLSPIPGVQDRRRLAVAIEFASASIAAKVLAGAHTTGGWTPRDPSRTVWLP